MGLSAISDSIKLSVVRELISNALTISPYRREHSCAKRISRLLCNIIFPAGPGGPLSYQTGGEGELFHRIGKREGRPGRRLGCVLGGVYDPGRWRGPLTMASAPTSAVVVSFMSCSTDMSIGSTQPTGT